MDSLRALALLARTPALKAEHLQALVSATGSLEAAANIGASVVPGVHLGMLIRNAGARKFYDRLGFVELAVEEPTVLLGRSTSPL